MTGGETGAGRPIVVVGSLNLDIVVPVPHHPAPGETVLGGENVRTPGGKGANQAAAAARLRGNVAMVGRVGDDDAGGLLTEALSDDGVDISRVEVTPGAPTGIAMIAVDEAGENTIVVSPGANSRVTETDVDAASSLLAGAAVTLLQLEIPIDAVTAAATRSGGVVVLNPAPARKLPQELLDNIDVLVPNQGELATLLGSGEPEGEDAVATMARSVKGPGVVVVTLGDQGALVVTPDDVVRAPAFDVTALDTTAAGDAFCGALAVALARHEPVDAASRWAAAAAALTVTKEGAQASLPSAREVEALIASERKSRE